MPKSVNTVATAKDARRSHRRPCDVVAGITTNRCSVSGGREIQAIEIMTDPLRPGSPGDEAVVVITICAGQGPFICDAKDVDFSRRKNHDDSAIRGLVREFMHVSTSHR